MDVQPHAIALQWLHTLAGVTSGDDDKLASSVQSLFAPDPWLRDLLVLSDDYHTLHGREEIVEYLSYESRMRHSQLGSFKLDTAASHGGAFIENAPTGMSVVLLFTFNIQHPISSNARACARLQFYEGDWKACTVLLVLHEVEGFEEKPCDTSTSNTGKTWETTSKERRTLVEKDPEVLIVGAGHNGLMTAARLQRLGIRTLIVDRKSLVGDSWSERYERLRLHTPAFMNTFPYANFPASWPKYFPKDKMALFLRFYAESQELVIWNSTSIAKDPAPVYSEVDKQWTIHIERDGEVVIVHPRHFVLATGWEGLPRRLEVPGTDDFGGKILHTSEMESAREFKGKKVVVVGAGNSGADLASDLVYHRASQVTLLQRSPSLILSMRAMEITGFTPSWSGKYPVDEQDLLNNCIPLNLLLSLLRAGGQEHALGAIDREMLEGLREKGFMTANTPLPELLYGRGGGFIIDQGAAEHIISGEIGVRSGVGIQSLERGTMVLTDGSRLEADAIVLATGFTPPNDKFHEALGAKIAGNIPPVYGYDSAGEMNNRWRPTPQPGLWFAMGDISFGRFFSRLLARQILKQLIKTRRVQTPLSATSEVPNM